MPAPLVPVATILLMATIERKGKHKRCILLDTRMITN
jgi:hypothetical protein